MSDGKGEVFLVGAGPGDPGLITVKGKAVIEKADVIVHDFLIPKELLSFAKKGTEIIDVSKRGGEHLVEQKVINEILLEKAKEGKTVVRLKGGDPFLFGRGGEEAEFLKRHGIDVHVIPGVTSAIAVPALAGIPVTHRDYSSAFTVVTGHESAEKEKEVLNWDALSSIGGTIVILMGVSAMERNIERLLAGGLDPETPVAVIERGATAEERVVTGSLSKISEICRRESIRPPALIVIGHVVSLRNILGDLR
ncbi:MAG: uroporphyrinogen-III C-methyltransferase [Methanomassiliicoccales archaeon]|jgi:uroporphyrin-III C-methyltransferase|nr:uroporphyrinogen-III C-methyltransferase [Methanomassiliicoccales archaeon]